MALLGEEDLSVYVGMNAHIALLKMALDHKKMAMGAYISRIINIDEVEIPSDIFVRMTTCGYVPDFQEDLKQDRPIRPDIIAAAIQHGNVEAVKYQQRATQRIVDAAKRAQRIADASAARAQALLPVDGEDPQLHRNDYPDM
jgi:hypothetical protein